MLLVAATFGSVPVGAQVFRQIPPYISPDDELLKDGLSSCGGLGEAPCSPFSYFYFSNNGFCDRGLQVKLEVIGLFDVKLTCVNGSRRQGVGTAFANTWAGRAIRIQRQDLNWTTSVSRMSFLDGHNAFNNSADGYLFPNQSYSMTELLDGGIRSIGWDVHAAEDPILEGFLEHPLTGRVAQLCHGGTFLEVSHVGCLPIDRDAVNIIKELRDWMLEPGHENEVVMINIENRIDVEDQQSKFTRALFTYLDVPGIGLFTPSDRTDFLATLDGTHEFADAIDREWPSQEYLVRTGNRVMIGGAARGLADGSESYYYETGDAPPLEIVNVGSGGGQKIVDEWALPESKPFPDCWIVDFKERKLRLFPLSGAFFNVYSDDFIGGPEEGGSSTINPEQIAGLTNCNVDSVSFDRMLDNTFDSDNRLAATVWSWEENHPPAEAGGLVARLSRFNSRWAAVPPGGQRRHLCRKDGVESLFPGFAGGGLKNIPTVTWGFSAAAGPWAKGHAACAMLGDEWKFMPPRNGYENSLAVEKMHEDGVDGTWINFASAGGDRWFITDDVSIDGIAVRPETIYAGAEVSFEALGEISIFAERWKWQFGDGSPDVAGLGDLRPTHRYTKEGTYTVKVEATLAGVQFLAERTIEVLVPPEVRDVAFGSDASLAVPEGVEVLVRVAHEPIWVLNTDSTTCGPDARTEFVDVPDGSSFDEFFLNKPWILRCTYHGGSNRASLISLEAHQRLNASLTARRDVPVTVVNQPPAIVASPISITYPQSQLGAILLEDAVGEQLSVRIAWGDFSFTDMSSRLPGPLTLEHSYSLSVGQQFQMRVEVSDESATTVATIPVTITGARPSVEILGPATSVVGALAQYEVRVSDPDGGLVELTFFSCGEGQQAEATTQSSLTCRFRQAADANTVLVTGRDEENLTTTTSMIVRIAADTAPPTFTFVPPPVTRVQTSAEGAVYAPEMAIAVDNIDPAPIVELNGVPPGQLFPVGTTTLTYVATDASGNHATATSTVTVLHNTPTGTDVRAHASDAVEVTFAKVRTRGFTTAQKIARKEVELPPAFVNLVDAFDVTTTAEVDGPVTSCFKLAQVIDRETFDKVRVLHREAGKWIDRSVRDPHAPAPDYTLRKLCARTDSLSPFALATLDVTPPTLHVQDVTVTGGDPAVAGAVVAFTPEASDDHSSVDLTCAPPSGTLFAFGKTTVTCTAADAAGNATTASFTVTVLDGVPPVIHALSLPGNGLMWPPNGRMVPMSVTASVTDNHSTPTCAITGVQGNEPLAAGDGRITGPMSVDLRARRAGGGSGRVYTMTVRCTDAAGNAATSQVTATVPHDQRK